jgi:hypothetical protein
LGRQIGPQHEAQAGDDYEKNGGARGEAVPRGGAFARLASISRSDSGVEMTSRPGAVVAEAISMSTGENGAVCGLADDVETGAVTQVQPRFASRLPMFVAFFGWQHAIPHFGATTAAQHAGFGVSVFAKAANGKRLATNRSAKIRFPIRFRGSIICATPIVGKRFPGYSTTAPNLRVRRWKVWMASKKCCGLKSGQVTSVTTSSV